MLKKLGMLLIVVIALAGLNGCSSDEQQNREQAERARAEQAQRQQVLDRVLALEAAAADMDAQITRLLQEQHQALSQLQNANRRLKQELQALREFNAMGVAGDMLPSAPPIVDEASTPLKQQPGAKASVKSVQDGETQKGQKSLLLKLILFIVILVAVLYIVRIIMDRMDDEIDPYEDDILEEDMDEEMSDYDGGSSDESSEDVAEEEVEIRLEGDDSEETPDEDTSDEDDEKKKEDGDNKYF